MYLMFLYDWEPILVAPDKILCDVIRKASILYIGGELDMVGGLGVSPKKILENGLAGSSLVAKFTTLQNPVVKFQRACS